MKSILVKSLGAVMVAVLLWSCSAAPGKKVNEPFTGSKYQTNNKYFRAKGNGQSNSQQVAKSKAMTNAKTNLAGSVRSNMKRVADAYIAETGNENASDLSDKFQSLSREIVNQEIGDIRTIGDQTYQQDDGTYKTYIALEAKKKSMYKWLKKWAELDKNTDEKTLEAYQKMLDKEIQRLEEIEAEE